MTETETWLHEKLERVAAGAPTLTRLGRVWAPVAGFRQCGSILAIYKDAAAKEYCVHAAEDWEDGAGPNMGYYSGSLEWNDLIASVAARYDEIRGSRG